MRRSHSLDDYKQQAKTLRTQLGNSEISHAQALEIVARQHGFRNWNTLHGSLGNRPLVRTFTPGARIRGAYLGHPFEGIVKSSSRWGTSGHTQLTIRFDAPVDVVEFDSFSAFRQQVTVIVAQDGTSPQTTSKGVPHLALNP